MPLTLLRLSRVEKTCFFIGNGRSGSTLAGAMLNAHPQMLFAFESYAFKRMAGQSRCRRLHLWGGTLRLAGRQAAEELHNTGYDYTIPGARRAAPAFPRVVGDKHAAPVSELFRKLGPKKLAAQALEGRPMCFVHMMRNPYDVITTMHRWHGPDHGRFKDDFSWRTPGLGIPDGDADPMRDLLEYAKRELRDGNRLPYLACHFFARAEGVWLLKTQGEPSSVIDVHYARLADAPRTELSRIAERLGVDRNEAWLRACERFAKPVSRTRTKLAHLWTEDLRKLTDEQISRFNFLQGYGWTQDEPRRAGG